MTEKMRLLSLCLMLCLISACASAEKPWVELKGKRFIVEIADEPAEQERGLMFRDDLPADHGMIFIYGSEQPQSYWMKNTHIPLDILFFDSQHKLVSMQQRVPPCSLGDRCPSFPSEGYAQYVLELNAGTAESLNVQQGDELIFAAAISVVK